MKKTPTKQGSFELSKSRLKKSPKNQDLGHHPPESTPKAANKGKQEYRVFFCTIHCVLSLRLPHLSWVLLLLQFYSCVANCLSANFKNCVCIPLHRAYNLIWDLVNFRPSHGAPQVLLLLNGRFPFGIPHSLLCRKPSTTDNSRRSLSTIEIRPGNRSLHFCLHLFQEVDCPARGRSGLRKVARRHAENTPLMNICLTVSH